MSNVAKWPMLSISLSDNELVKKIKVAPGPLQSRDDRDILMIAASIAVALNIAPAPQQKTTGHDIMNGPTLGSAPLDDYRQHMLLVYWSTKVKGDDLSEMGDTKAIVENFKDYAHRGLLYMSEVYLKPDGDKKLEDKFLELMKTFKKH